MHGFSVKAFFAYAWVRWRDKLAPIKNNLGPRDLLNVPLKQNYGGSTNLSHYLIDGFKL
jgi:hypothetical protein